MPGVPVENLLGEVGKGGESYFYSLNPGRFSIGASALGMGKENLRIATQYAMQRVQFGKPLFEHGLIQQKLANMAVRLFALESMLYQAAGWWDSRRKAWTLPRPKEQVRFGQHLKSMPSNARS